MPPLTTPSNRQIYEHISEGSTSSATPQRARPPRSARRPARRSCSASRRLPASTTCRGSSREVRNDVSHQKDLVSSQRQRRVTVRPSSPTYLSRAARRAPPRERRPRAPPLPRRARGRRLFRLRRLERRARRLARDRARRAADRGRARRARRRRRRGGRSCLGIRCDDLAAAHVHLRRRGRAGGRLLDSVGATSSAFDSYFRVVTTVRHPLLMCHTAMLSLSAAGGSTSSAAPPSGTSRASRGTGSSGATTPRPRTVLARRGRSVRCARCAGPPLHRWRSNV